MAGLQHAVHIKRVGRQILANLISRRLHEAWNAWLDTVQVRPSRCNAFLLYISNAIL